MSGVDLLSSLLKVAAVLILLVGSLRVLAKYQRGSSKGKGTARRSQEALIEVLDQTRLGRVANLIAVRVGDRVLLLGVTDGNVENLADVTDSIDLTVDEEDDDLSESSVLDHAVDLLRTGAFRRG